MGQSHEILSFNFGSWQSNQYFLYVSSLFTNIFAALLLRNLNMNFFLASMKLITNSTNPFSNPLHRSSSGLQKAAYEPRTGFTVMGIVSVSCLGQCYFVKAFIKLDQDLQADNEKFAFKILTNARGRKFCSSFQ